MIFWCSAIHQMMSSVLWKWEQMKASQKIGMKSRNNPDRHRGKKVSDLAMQVEINLASVTNGEYYIVEDILLKQYWSINILIF